MLRWLPALFLSACFYVTADDRAERFDLDGDGVPRPEDCDDDDPKVGEITWYADTDEDGFGDPGARETSCSAPDGFVADPSDCDDSDALRFPEAPERCDGADDDCDGVADDGAEVPTWYEDVDGDGQGDPAAPVSACDQPAGAVANADDCDDTDELVKVGGVEVGCNDLDDDCDGDLDLDDADVDLLAWTWYWDLDGDGFGRDDVFEVGCTAPADHVPDPGDCRDNDAAINPDGVEACNGEDDDCDGVTDPYGSVGAVPWEFDLDLDGFGDPTNVVSACAQPNDTVPAGGADDCDDADACVYAGAQEVCNGQDDDCDVINVDEGCVPIDLSDPAGNPCY